MRLVQAVAEAPRHRLEGLRKTPGVYARERIAPAGLPAVQVTTVDPGIRVLGRRRGRQADEREDPRELPGGVTEQVLEPEEGDVIDIGRILERQRVSGLPMPQQRPQAVAGPLPGRVCHRDRMPDHDHESRPRKDRLKEPHPDEIRR